MLYAAVTPNWWIWCITIKKNELRFHLNRAPADPFEVALKRARVSLERVRTNFDDSCRSKRGRRPQFASWLKGIKIGALGDQS